MDRLKTFDMVILNVQMTLITDQFVDIHVMLVMNWSDQAYEAALMTKYGPGNAHHADVCIFGR